MSFTSEEPHVSSLDQAQVAEYRRFSVAALVAAVLGVASALALAHPLLWVVPPVAIVVALVALRAIQAEDSNLVGRKTAIFGLALALLFGIWAPARSLSRQWYLYGQAKPYADQWLELVRQGKVYEAHQLTRKPIERQDPRTSLEKYYSESREGKPALEQFTSQQPLKSLLAAGTKATYRYLGGDGILPPEFQSENILLMYQVRCDDPKLECPQRIRIVLERSPVPDSSDYLWRVLAVQDPNRDEK